jgi:hypothetical protein
MDYCTAESRRSKSLGVEESQSSRIYALAVDRPGYYHTGICLGDGTVVHFWGNRADSVVTRTSLGTFIAGSPRVWTLEPPGTPLSPSLSALLALISLGRGGFNIRNCNCEHFTYFCLTGRKRSPQVFRSYRQPILSGLAAVLSTASYYRRRSVQTSLDVQIACPASTIYAVHPPRFFLGDIWLTLDGTPFFRIAVRAPHIPKRPEQRLIQSRHVWCEGVPHHDSTWSENCPRQLWRVVGSIYFTESLTFYGSFSPSSFCLTGELSNQITATEPVDWVPPILRARLETVASRNVGVR